MLFSIIFGFVAYIIGSINFSIIASKFYHLKDPRLQGSKNAGSTNLARYAGKRIATTVLLLDILRALGVMFLVKYLECSSFIALPMLAGNIFPIFHKFKGGKGVAMFIGITLALSWQVLLIGLLVFAITTLIYKRVSLGSILAVISCAIAAGAINGWTSIIFQVFALMAITIIVTHRANMRRLLKNQEPKFK